MVEMIIELKRVENKFALIYFLMGLMRVTQKSVFLRRDIWQHSQLSLGSFRLQVDMSENWVFLSQAFPHIPHHLLEKVIVRLLDCQVDSFSFALQIYDEKTNFPAIYIWIKAKYRKEM